MYLKLSLETTLNIFSVFWLWHDMTWHDSHSWLQSVSEVRLRVSEKPNLSTCHALYSVSSYVTLPPSQTSCWSDLGSSSPSPSPSLYNKFLNSLVGLTTICTPGLDCWHHILTISWNGAIWKTFVRLWSHGKYHCLYQKTDSHSEADISRKFILSPIMRVWDFHVICRYFRS